MEDQIQNGVTTTPVLHEIFSVRAANSPDVLILDIEITDMNGERYRCEYASHPDDPYGLNPVIRQWLLINEGSYEIQPYVPPTPEQIREVMPALTSRQFWRAAASIGITKAAVLAMVEASEHEDKEDILIEISESSSFERTSPYILVVSQMFGLDPETLDSIWSWAYTL